MKKLLLLITALLITNCALASDDSCLYKPGSFILRCSNNMPGASITPGSNGSISFKCCFTSDYYKDNDGEVDITYRILNEYFHRAQNTDLSWSNVTEHYPASSFITSVVIPNSSRGFNDFEVIINYALPATSEHYKPGAVLYSRIDIKALIPGVFIPNNAVYPRIIIPADWKPDNTVQIITGSVGGGLLAGALIALIKRKKKSGKLSRVMRKVKN